MKTASEERHQIISVQHVTRSFSISGLPQFNSVRPVLVFQTDKVDFSNGMHFNFYDDELCKKVVDFLNQHIDSISNEPKTQSELQSWVDFAVRQIKP
jgi:hypothetical protein